MIKAVLFDLDNTLTDFMYMKRISCEAAINAMIDSGLKMDKDAAEKKLFELYKTHGIEDQTIFQKFLTDVQGSVDYRMLANAITAYRRRQAGVLVPYPHVRSTLIKLKERGIKLAIVSDAQRMRAWLRLSEMNLTEFFDVVVTLDDTGKLKPDEAPFKSAIQKINVRPNEILFIGDNPDRDIKGAKQLGMKTALAKYGQQFFSDDVIADYELNDFADLLRVITSK